VEEELKSYAASGGRTLVELTPVGACRNIDEIVRLSKASGLHIIAGTGYYTQRSHPPDVAVNDIEWLAREMVRDIEEGIDGTPARAGVIGEIGTSLPILDQERKVLAASVFASKVTGRSIVVHVQPPAHFAHEVLDILFQEGAKPDRVVLAHMDSTLRPGLTYHRELLSRGVSIIYDGFGMEWDFPSLGLRTPSDEDRVNAVVELVASDFINQLLLSQDVCTKIHLAFYGGPGYSHLITRVLPMLLERGLSDSELTTIVKTNPANYIAATNRRD
jgi:phosphotriesterase-related protein